MSRTFLRSASPALVSLALFAVVPACGSDATIDALIPDGSASLPPITTTDGDAGATACTPGTTEECYGGPAGTRGVGACKAGKRTCNADGSGFGACEGEIVPATEVCDDAIVDEDCNGRSNESGGDCACVPGATASCYEGPDGTLGVGTCAAGTKTCATDGKGYGACTGEHRPDVEVCDGTDNDEDCDGQVNEEGAGCNCIPGSTASCYEGPAGTVGVGACKAGTFTCTAAGTGYGPCTGQSLPALEVCDGTLVDESCDGQVNESGAGCVCVPGSKKSCYEGPAGTLGVGTCVGGMATCNAEGTGYGACDGQVLPKTDACSTSADEDCNGSNLTCGSNTQDCADATGTCEDSCSAAVLGTSNVGCVFYPTVTANVIAPTPFHFGVAVSNTSDKPASVTVTRGATTIATVTVAAQSAQVIQLPWVSELLSPTQSVRSNKGAYKLTSTRGVTAYQFNALEYQLNGAFSSTGDASLLLPVNAWNSSYRVVARHHFKAGSGFVTVVAQTDGTNVTFATGPQSGLVKSGVAGIGPTGAGSITMNAGDVVQLLTNGANMPSDPNDVTGMLVTSDKAIEVIGGHQCTYVPDNVGYCDHLEESILPVETLGTEYVVSAPWIKPNTPKAQLVRVIATAANTTLAYDPPQPGAPTAIAAAGGWVELPSSANAYKITASAKVLVAQYMLGQDAGGGAGDPSLTVTIPTSQFRSSYRFYASTTFSSNFANIVAKTGTTVTVDGVALATAFTPIGGSGYGYARIQLPNNGTGFHTVKGSTPVDVQVYGYGQYTSYSYPAGLK